MVSNDRVYNVNGVYMQEKENGQFWRWILFEKFSNG